MLLTGSSFCCDLPDGWSVSGEAGCVIGTAPTPLMGFTPNVVLRESQVDGRPDTLAKRIPKAMSTSHLLISTLGA